MKTSFIITSILALTISVNAQAQKLSKDEVTKELGFDFTTCVENAKANVRSIRFDETSTTRKKVDATLTVQPINEDSVEGYINRTTVALPGGEAISFWDADYQAHFKISAISNARNENRACGSFLGERRCTGWFETDKAWTDTEVTGSISIALYANKNTDYRLKAQIIESKVDHHSLANQFVKQEVIPKLEKPIQDCVESLLKSE